MDNKIYEIHKSITERSGIPIFRFGESIHDTTPPFVVFEFQPFERKSYSVAKLTDSYKIGGNVLYSLHSNNQRDANIFESYFNEHYNDVLVKVEDVDIEYNTLANGEKLDVHAFTIYYEFYKDNVRRVS